MFEALFSFRGRINRLRYFLSVLGLGMAAGLLAVVGVIMIAGHGDLRDNLGALATLGPLLLLALLILPVFLWISLSLQARRFRDIGWNPLYVIPAWIMADVIDFMLAKAVPALAIGKLHNQTLIGGLIGLVLSSALLFWPGRAGDDPEAGAETRWPEPSAPAERRPAAPARSPTPEPRPAPVARAPMAQPAAIRTGFGRRGL